MSEKSKRSPPVTTDITLTLEYRKMREAYPDYSEEMVRQLAEQAIKLRLQRELAGTVSRKQAFENEVKAKVADLVAGLAVKYDYDIHGKQVCVQAPKLQLKYSNVAELAKYLDVSVNDKSVSVPEPQPASYRPVSTPVEPARPAQTRPPAARNAAARVFLRLLRLAVIFLGSFLLFYGIYLFLDIGYVPDLTYTAAGVIILLLLRIIPR